MLVNDIAIPTSSFLFKKKFSITIPNSYQITTFLPFLYQYIFLFCHTFTVTSNVRSLKMWNGVGMSE